MILPCTVAYCEFHPRSGSIMLIDLWPAASSAAQTAVFWEWENARPSECSKFVIDGKAECFADHAKSWKYLFKWKVMRAVLSEGSASSPSTTYCNLIDRLLHGHFVGYGSERAGA